MGTQTPNYGFNKPTLKSGDLMSDFDTWLNSNWTRIEDIPAPPSGTTLPQSGTYNIGDRFYKTDTKSIYILTGKDANWGWFWRPVHDAISPWFVIPATCMNITGWTINPVPANPFAVALDNRGKCYWRGVVGIASGTFARNASFQLFKPLPDAIRPRQQSTFMIGHETLAVSANASALTSYQGARIFLGENPTSVCSVRGFGGLADFNLLHLTGIQYAVGTSKYWTV